MWQRPDKNDETKGHDRPDDDYKPDHPHTLPKAIPTGSYKAVEKLTLDVRVSIATDARQTHLSAEGLWVLLRMLAWATDAAPFRRKGLPGKGFLAAA